MSGFTGSASLVSGPLTKVSGGDANVQGREDSQTEVHLLVRFSRTESTSSSGAYGGGRALLDVEFLVKELGKDNTVLKFASSVEIPISFALVGAPVVTPGYDRTWVVRGKLDEFTPIPGSDGTMVAPGSTYRLHGAGDDLSNAKIDLKLSVTLAPRA